ncbi:DinB family protein [Chloroflexota bacterium]
MKREQLLKRVDQGWREFLAVIEGLHEDVVLEPGVVGEWSIRDVITHIATWEEEALAALPVILKGKRTPRYIRYGGIDAFNALSMEKKRYMSLSEARGALTATHKRLMDYLSGVPESAYTTENRFRRRLRLDTYNHYREHTGQIEAWLRDKQY